MSIKVKSKYRTPKVKITLSGKELTGVFKTLGCTSFSDRRDFRLTDSENEAMEEVYKAIRLELGVDSIEL